MDPISQLRMDFNRVLIDTIGGEVLNQSIFAWNGGITKYMLGFCLAIAFFQSVLRSEREFLLEWVKIVIATWFCMAILGGVNYSSVPILSKLNSVPQEYQIKAGPRTLDRAAFNYLAYTFDKLGKAVLSTSPNTLAQEMARLNDFQRRFIVANVYCSQSDQKCLKDSLSGVKQKELDAEAAKGEEPGVIDKMNPGYWLSLFYEKIILFTNPFYWLFGGLLWILEIVRGFVNYFVLLVFGLTAALSLFMIKIVAPFMVIPSYRNRVISAFKVVAATTMFGFATNLIIYISIIITKALNFATATILVERITSNGVLLASAELGTLMVGNFLTSLVILAMQIVAIAKVPKFCRSLLNLSLEEIVNVGETLVSAGLGVAKIAAGIAAGGAGIGLGALGTMAGNKFQNLTGERPGDFVGDKLKSLVGATPRDKGGGSQDAFFTQSSAQGLNRGGNSPSLEKAMLGDVGPINAKTSSGQTSILDSKKGSEGKSGVDKEKMSAVLDDENLSVEDKLAQIKDMRDSAGSKKGKRGGGGSSDGGGPAPVLNRPELAVEKQAKEEAKLKAAKDRKAGMVDNFVEQWMPDAGTLGKNIGSALGGLVMDGMNIGAGTGSSVSTLTKGIDNFGKGVNENLNDINDYVADSLKAAPRDVAPELSKAEKGILGDQVLRVVEEGKRDLSGIESQRFDQDLQKIASGQASNDDMMKVYATMNQANVSDAQKAQYQQVLNQNKKFNNFVSSENAASQQLMTSASEQMAKSGQLDSKTLAALSSRTAAGLMDYDMLKNASYNVAGPNGTSTSASVLSSLKDQSKKDIDTSLAAMEQAVQSGQGLDEKQIREAQLIERFSSDQLVGNSQRIAQMNNIFGGTKDFSHLDFDTQKASDDVLDTAMKMGQQLAQIQKMDSTTGGRYIPSMEMSNNFKLGLGKTDPNAISYDITSLKVGPGRGADVSNVNELMALRPEMRDKAVQDIRHFAAEADKYLKSKEVQTNTPITDEEREYYEKMTNFMKEGDFGKVLDKEFLKANMSPEWLKKNNIT